MKLTQQLKIAKTLLGLVVALFAFGCATTYEMQVDAISNPSPEIKEAESYVIVPRDPETDTSELRYKETVKWIKTALSAKGMFEAVDPLTADMVIQVDYGMEPPRQEIRIVEEPVYARVQEPDSYVSVPITDANGRVVGYQTVRVPGGFSTELIGTRERAISVIVNEKYLVLSAKENNLQATDGDKAAEELWSVTVVNDDSSDNLREYLPIMAASATDYIGEDTGSKTTVRLKDNAEVVDFIKKGLAKERP